MKRALGLSMLGLALVLSGCATGKTPQAAYLETAQNYATQDEVKQQLGPPRLTKPLETGGSVWVYESYGWFGGDRNTPGQFWCDQYSLTFDPQAVLRQWNYRWIRRCVW